MGYFPKIMAIAIAVVFVAAACSSDSSDNVSTATTNSPGTASAAADASASNVQDHGCPDRLIVQTDWFPEPEHGYLYQLIGDDGVIDSTNGTYSGLIDGTDITLEIRAGGPYIGFLDPSAQFYADRDIFMAYVNTSSAIETYKATPSVAVFTSFEVGPQILLFDPETYDFETFEDLRDSGATVVHFDGANYIKFLVAQGLIDPENTDGSYDGSPSRFIAEEGRIVQQGFATAEPYKYENEHEGWKRPVDYLLIHDSGHKIYQSALAVKPATIQTHADCLKLIVPLMQQGLKDYMAAPEPVNIRLDEIVKALNSFWTSSIDGHNWSSAQMRSAGLVTDGDNDYVGDMDDARIQKLIDDLTPVYRADNTDGFDESDPRLLASEIFTNEFLDPTISLGY